MHQGWPLPHQRVQPRARPYCSTTVITLAENTCVLSS